MEFAIPISRFNPSNVQSGSAKVSPFRKIIPFLYNDGQLTLNSLILVLHPLQVVEIDWTRNQLVLEEVNGTLSFLSKLEQMQETLNTSLEAKLDGGYLKPWIKSRRLTLYLSTDPKSIPYFSESVPTIFSESTVKPGDMIRAVVKLQGVSLQMSEDDLWTGRSRIQHHVLQLYKVSKSD